MRIILSDGTVVEREDNRPAKPKAEVTAEKKPKATKRGRPSSTPKPEAEPVKAVECSLPTKDSKSS